MVPTIKVEHPDGYAIINESDFDPAIHKKFGKKKSAVSHQTPEAPEPAAPGLATRRTELESLGWRELKALLTDTEAEAKPESETWSDYAIPLILERENAG